MSHDRECVCVQLGYLTLGTSLETLRVHITTGQVFMVFQSSCLLTGFHIARQNSTEDCGTVRSWRKDKVIDFKVNARHFNLNSAGCNLWNSSTSLEAQYSLQHLGQIGGVLLIIKWDIQQTAGKKKRFKKDGCQEITLNLTVYVATLCLTYKFCPTVNYGNRPARSVCP